MAWNIQSNPCCSHTLMIITMTFILFCIVILLFSPPHPTNSLHPHDSPLMTTVQSLAPVCRFVFVLFCFLIMYIQEDCVSSIFPKQPFSNLTRRQNVLSRISKQLFSRFNERQIVKRTDPDVHVTCFDLIAMASIRADA